MTIKDWDDCISFWYHNYVPSSVFLIGSMAPYGSMTALSFDYLPEPYYGDYKNCIAPVININPGLDEMEDVCKDWNKRTNPTGSWSHPACGSCNGSGSCKPGDGQLVYDFDHKYHCKYSEWQKYYSPFVAPPCVPGVIWWKKNRNEYINRVVELYGAFKSDKGVPALPEKEEDAKNTFKGRTPYALELCPLHSKSAPSLSEDFIATFIDNTIAPACVSLKYSTIPFGLGFGKKVYDVLVDSKLFVECKRWENGYDGATKSPIPGWPSGTKGKIHRTYALLKGKCGETVEFNGEEITFDKEGPYFLVTWYQGGYSFTHQSMLNFDAVDRYVVAMIP